MREHSEQIEPVRLRLELVSDYQTSNDKLIMKRYGESLTGDSIIRELMIPSDMTLHALHYAIQKLFGWQNSHLRQFVLPEEVYSQLTGQTVKGWSDLVGVLFQAPSEAEHDLYWDDDYESGSFAVWLRKRYTGPYSFEGYYEQYEAARQDIEDMLDRFKEMEVRESFSDYLARKEKNHDTEPKKARKASLIDLTIDELHASIAMESGTESLMEKLIVADILAPDDDETNEEEKSVTNELFYEYDFGDGWRVKITRKDYYHDLLLDCLVSAEELEEAAEVVISKHKPVCLVREGLSVMDDVGGMSGYARFLQTIYEGEDKEEAADSRRWAKYMGWNQKKTVPKKIL